MMSAQNAIYPQLLNRRVRAHLLHVADRGEPITYKALAEAMELRPPNTIHQVTQALEWLMREDAANEHPFIAALVISRSRHGLPAPGFFDIAKELGRFEGPPAVSDATVAYDAMFRTAVAFWRSGGPPDIGGKTRPATGYPYGATCRE